jgi:hypothetical protein
MGDSSQTQTTTAKESSGGWKPAQAGLQGILNQAQGMLGNTGLNSTEQGAINGMANNAQLAGGYGSQIQGLTDKLFAGGGLGQGMQGMQQAWQTAQNALSPIASGNLDPMQNPQMAQMLQQINDQARNSVGSQFAAAGRGAMGDSAAQTGAFTKAFTEGALPALFNQYNQNAQNSMNASNSLMQGSQGYSQGMDNAAGNQLNAQMQAPGSLNNMNQPQMMALQAEAQRRGIPIQNLADLNSLMVPIAQTGKEGTTKSTGTVTQQNDPWQTAAGGILGGIGVAGQLGILSDARAKENARPVGSTFDGQTIYAFNYIGDPRTTIGLMAQEVQQKYPEAVSEWNGMLLVDYAMATANSARGGL